MIKGDKAQIGNLLTIFALIAIILIIYNIYTGLTVKRIGIPGIFEVEFGTPTSTPTPTPETGSISVSSTPSGASIYLDGIYKGTTPMTIEKVEAGSHTINLKYTGYQDWSQNILVVASETTYVSAPLTSTPPKPITVSVNTNPRTISAGGSTVVSVVVLSDNSPVPNANVKVGAGGGYFSDTGNTVSTGTTDNNGVFKTVWYTYDRSVYTGTGYLYYAFSVSVNKQGYVSGDGEDQVKVTW